MNNNTYYNLPFDEKFDLLDYTLMNMNARSTYCLNTCLKGTDVNKPSSNKKSNINSTSTKSKLLDSKLVNPKTTSTKSNLLDSKLSDLKTTSSNSINSRSTSSSSIESRSASSSSIESRSASSIKVSKPRLFTYESD